jgi:predicted dehydrogenase
MIQVGLVGAGYWGPNIAKSFELTGRAQIRWLCDLDAARLARLGEKYISARTTLELAEVLQDGSVDAIAISTPASTHFALASRALEAGKHVLVEKPITETSGQAAQLIRLARETGKILMVGHVFEYNATIHALKELITSGELGEVYYLNFERTNLGPVRTDVNALLDLASHDISIMIHLLDACPVEVTARGRAFLNPGVEDAVFSTFTFASGALAHVHASWLNPQKVRRITVIGSRKMAIWNDLDLKAPIQIFDKRIAEPADIPDTFIGYKTVPVEGNTTIPKIPLNQPLLSECEHFLDCVELGAEPRSGGASGLRVVAALEAAARSMANGSIVTPIELPSSYSKE